MIGSSSNSEVASSISSKYSGLFRFPKHKANALEEIDQALQQKDWVLMQRLVHSLKGIAANISAISTANSSLMLELALKAENFEEIETGIQNLRCEFQLLLNEIEQLKYNL